MRGMRCNLLDEFGRFHAQTGGVWCLTLPAWPPVRSCAAGLAVVRFRTERFDGHVAMHCHVNSHSDTGIMAVAQIYGSADAQPADIMDPEARAPGTCG